MKAVPALPQALDVLDEPPPQFVSTPDPFDPAELRHTDSPCTNKSS
jgi:hypothetical protein